MVIPDEYILKAIDRQGNGHLGALEDYTLFITDKNFKLKIGRNAVSSHGQCFGRV
jgi:hypothetical protein